MQRPDNVRRADCLASAHLDDSADLREHPLQESTKVQAGLAVDARGNALHASAAGEATDIGFGDALDVVAEDFPEGEELVVFVRYVCEETLYCSPVAFSAAYLACAEAAVAQSFSGDASATEAANGSLAASRLASGRTRWSHVEMPDMRCCGGVD